MDSTAYLLIKLAAELLQERKLPGMGAPDLCRRLTDVDARHGAVGLVATLQYLKSR